MCLLVFGLDDDDDDADDMERYEYCNHWLLSMCVYIHIFVPKDTRQSDLFSCNKKYPVPPNAHECTTNIYATHNHQTHQTQKYHRSLLMRIVVTTDDDNIAMFR